MSYIDQLPPELRHMIAEYYASKGYASAVKKYVKSQHVVHGPGLMSHVEHDPARIKAARKKMKQTASVRSAVKTGQVGSSKDRERHMNAGKQAKRNLPKKAVPAPSERSPFP